MLGQECLNDYSFSLVFVWIIIGLISISQPICSFSMFLFASVTTSAWLGFFQKEPFANLPCLRNLRRIIHGSDKSFYLHGNFKRYKNDLTLTPRTPSSYPPNCLSLSTDHLWELWSTSSLYPPFPNPSNRAPIPTYSTVLSNLCNPLLWRSGTKFTNNWGRCISKAIWKNSSFHLSIWQGWLHCLLAAIPSAATCLTNPLGLLLPFRFLFLILPSGLSLFTKLLNSGSS